MTGTIWIIGGSGDIGRAIGREFGDREGSGNREESGGRGWTVWLSARTESRLRDATEELRAEGIETERIRLDAADPQEVERGVERLADAADFLDVLVYNVSPQATDDGGRKATESGGEANDGEKVTDGGGNRLESYLRHTAIGAATALEGLRGAGLAPEHVIVPTSSKARDPAAVSPDYHAAKQALFAYVEAFTEAHDATASILWLGRRGTERDWRWLRPEEMAAKAWQSYEIREPELLVGDLY